MSATITRDEWLQALGEAVKALDPDALTVRELAALLGVSRPAAYRHAEALVAHGRAVKTWKRGAVAGQGSRPVPAYRLVTPEKGRKR